NREDTSVTALAAGLMDAIIDQGFPTAHPARRVRLTSPAATPSAPNAIEGVYVDHDAGEWVTLGFEDGVLRGDTLGDPFFLYPDDDGTFRDGDDYRATVPVELQFEPGPNGLVGRLNLGGQILTLRRCEAPRVQTLGDFAGIYESREMDTRHRIR